MKTTLRCPNPSCGMPLAQREGNVITVLRNQGGEKLLTEIQVQHYGNGHFKVRCQRCGGGHIFVTIHESISLHDKCDATVK